MLQPFPRSTGEYSRWRKAPELRKEKSKRGRSSGGGGLTETVDVESETREGEVPRSLARVARVKAIMNDSNGRSVVKRVSKGEDDLNNVDQQELIRTSRRERARRRREGEKGRNDRKGPSEERELGTWPVRSRQSVPGGDIPTAS
jgi:hypothetical protein